MNANEVCSAIDDANLQGVVRGTRYESIPKSLVSRLPQDVAQLAVQVLRNKSQSFSDNCTRGLNDNRTHRSNYAAGGGWSTRDAGTRPPQDTSSQGLYNDQTLLWRGHRQTE